MGDGKLPGKTEWAGRRRPMTRTAGFKVQAPVEMERTCVDGYALGNGDELLIEFTMPEVADDVWLGFGGWLYHGPEVEVHINFKGPRYVDQTPDAPLWGKFGSLFRADATPARSAALRLRAKADSVVAVYGLMAGAVAHEHLNTARAALLKNMWTFAPEANFYDPKRPGTVSVPDQDMDRIEAVADLHLKSCNRCGRFLPVNLANERSILSFSSHCVAMHRLPCSHTGFGRIQMSDGSGAVTLRHGFQLECRFCKKFEVNAAHNPQRSAGQMKEDGARRRHFELLLEHLYEGTPQLRFKNATGRDLAEFIYERFDGRCFKCGTALASPRAMHLDHTRPLAYLWPLDETATALCATHNSEKRDRMPVEYYTEDELVRLAGITGIPLKELRNPSVNKEAVDLLGADLFWFEDVFLEAPALQRVHDGKKPADLLVKALSRALQRYPGGAPFTVK